MLTIRRTVADWVRMCTGLATPSRIGPSVTPPPEAAFSRLNEMFAASIDGMISRLASPFSRAFGNTVGWVDHGSRLAHDALASTEVGHAPAHRAHVSGEFVAEDARIIDPPAVIAGPHVKVAAADADRRHFEQHVLVADFRHGHVAQFDTVGFAVVGDDGGLGGRAAHVIFWPDNWL